MKFGLFGGATARRGQRSDDSTNYHEFVEMLIDAEKMGYHSFFLVEHHFTGVGQVSASLNLLSYLAARTTTMRLGSGVIVVPWHNPILLAEQAATVDLLSNGRLDFGVGKGYRPAEFNGFCLPLEEATDRFEESMELIRQAFTSEERFSWHSKRWDFDNIIVEPPPVQKPYPPLWQAAGRPESLQKAAKDGYSLLLDQFCTFEVALERFRIYRDAVEAEGRTFNPMNVAVARGLAIVDTEEEREQAIQMRMAGLERMNSQGQTADKSYVSSMVSDPDLRKAAEQGTLIGTVDQIVERLWQLRNGGIEYVLFAVPGAAKFLRRFHKEVMPELA